MNKLSGWDDTIVALATPPGVGAIGVIRLSGKNAISILNGLLVDTTTNKSKEVSTENFPYVNSIKFYNNSNIISNYLLQNELDKPFKDLKKFINSADFEILHVLFAWSYGR